jgi:cytochrome P450
VGSLLYEVLSTPETRSRIQEDTNRVSAAVEEALRLHAPLFGFFRRATRPVSVKGVEIPQGSTVYLSFAAANRDAKVFKHPVDFNLDRGARAHLSFGHGIHTCVGAQTARMELRIGLSAILRRLPDVRLADGFEPTYVFGGTETAELRALPVEFTPR